MPLKIWRPRHPGGWPHIQEVMEAVMCSSQEGRWVKIEQKSERRCRTEASANIVHSGTQFVKGGGADFKDMIHNRYQAGANERSE
jgi:hypothetical protein